MGYFISISFFARGYIISVSFFARGYIISVSFFARDISFPFHSLPVDVSFSFHSLPGQYLIPVSFFAGGDILIYLVFDLINFENMTFIWLKLHAHPPIMSYYGLKCK
jgi:hypothetical protein